MADASSSPNSLFKTAAAPILDLPFDICHLFLRHLSIPDVLNIRQTCKSFYRATKSHLLWQSLLTSLATQQIPLPRLFDRSLNELSSSELEDIGQKAWTLHRKWTAVSPSPTAKHQIPLGVVAMQPGGMAPIFDFVPGGGQRYFITLVMLSRTEDGPLYDLRCWDLEAKPAKCIAHRVINHGRFILNKNQKSPARLAVQSPSIELLGIDYSSERPDDGFYTVSKLSDITGRLAAFDGSLIATQNDQNQVFLIDLSVEGETDHVELRSFQPQARDQAIEVLIQDDIVIIVRLTRLEVFLVNDPDTEHGISYPVGQHVWQWSLDTVSILSEKTWIPGSKSRRPPINILLRFNSALPWPVNLIHHFVLLPNPWFGDDEPASANNVPYNTIPILRRLIGSPIRLFSRYHMALGSRGTAVWIDTHTEHYYGRGDTGQRLAGSRPEPLDAADDDEIFGTSNIQGDFSMNTSVFGYCEDDGWAHVAVDEEEGKIAIGHLDGTITLYEYA